MRNRFYVPTPFSRRTVDLCRQLQAAGISFLTVHGRTAKERSQPVRLETIRTIVDALDIPVIANGDVNSLEIAHSVQEFTGAQGVMSARGIIENPGLYAGYFSTPMSALKRWIEITNELNINFTLFHRHLVHMTEKILRKPERRLFNELKTKAEVLDMLNDKFDLESPSIMTH